MPWVKIDDHFDEHPKHAQAGPLAWALWLAGLAYCNRNLTDGFIPWAAAQKLVSWEFLDPPDEEGRQKRWCIGVTCGMGGGDVTADDVIPRLISAGLWEACDGGFRVHDYDDYQPTKREVLKQRRQTAERVSAFRGRKRNAKSNAVGNASSNAVGNTAPVPVPVPVPVPQRNNLAGDSAPAGIGAPQKPDRKQPDPRVRAVIAAWHDGFKAKFGEPPPVNGAKAGAIAKRLLTGRSEEQAVGLVREFLRSPPDFYAQRRLYGLEHVLAAAPSLLAKKGERRLEKQSRLCPACGEGHLWRGDVRLDACPKDEVPF